MKNLTKAKERQLADLQVEEKSLKAQLQQNAKKQESLIADLLADFENGTLKDSTILNDKVKAVFKPASVKTIIDTAKLKQDTNLYNLYSKTCNVKSSVIFSIVG